VYPFDSPLPASHSQAVALGEGGHKGCGHQGGGQGARQEQEDDRLKDTHPSGDLADRP
jgi:hypothetical protein